MRTMAHPSYPRARRLAETVKRLAGEWVESEQADGRLGFVTVTDARVTPDLRHACVYWTVLGGEEEQAATSAALGESVGRARTFVARRVRLRHAPTLEFRLDDVPGRSARIEALLAQLGAADRDAGREGA